MSKNMPTDDSAGSCDLPISDNTQRLYSGFMEETARWPEMETYNGTIQKLTRTYYGNPFPYDPRYNTVHWIAEYSRNIVELARDFCWMKAHAEARRNELSSREWIPVRPQEYDTFVQRHAVHALVWAIICRDKLALAVCAYFEPFNPESVKNLRNFKDVLTFLNERRKTDDAVSPCRLFLAALEALDGSDFRPVKELRDYVVHRSSPNVFVDEVPQNWGFPYMIPLLTPKEIRKKEQEILERFKETPRVASKVLEDNRVGGILFKHEPLEKAGVGYPQMEEILEKALRKLLQAASTCIETLLEREPLKTMFESPIIPGPGT